jgi:hypothetical protein
MAPVDSDSVTSRITGILKMALIDDTKATCLEPDMKRALRGNHSVMYLAIL